MSVVLERRRTGWDLALGAVLVVLGFVILGHAVIATAVSVLFMGWMALIAGVIALVASLFRIGKGGFWATALIGGVLAVLGLMIIRNPLAAAFTLTLVAGALFLTGGIVRLVAASQNPEQRWALVFGGVVSTALGLIVLFNMFEATLVLLGVLLGVQTIVDGMSMMIMGRMRITPSDAAEIPAQSRRDASAATEQKPKAGTVDAT